MFTRKVVVGRYDDAVHFENYQRGDLCKRRAHAKRRADGTVVFREIINAPGGINFGNYSWSWKILTMRVRCDTTPIQYEKGEAFYYVSRASTKPVGHDASYGDCSTHFHGYNPGVDADAVLACRAAHKGLDAWK